MCLNTDDAEKTIITHSNGGSCPSVIGLLFHPIVSIHVLSSGLHLNHDPSLNPATCVGSLAPTSVSLCIILNVPLFSSFLCLCAIFLILCGLHSTFIVFLSNP